MVPAQVPGKDCEIFVLVLNTFVTGILNYFIGINFRGYNKLSRFRDFFGVRESLHPRNLTFEVTREILIKIQKKGENSHENQKI